MEKEYIKQHPDFEGLKWVLKAISKKDDRYALDHVFSLGKSLFASDGHRAHFYRMSDPLPKGSYKPIVDKKAIVFLPADVLMPDIMSCIPKHTKPIKVNINSTEKLNDGNAVAYSKMVRAMNQDVTLNHKYFCDMLGDSSFKVTHSTDGREPIVFRNGRKFGVIMPMRA